MGYALNRAGGLLVVVVGLLVTAAIYWPGLHGGFFFDDHANILGNRGLVLEEISLRAFQAALQSGISGQFGRPVSQVSFALNNHFSGFNPFAFKFTNLVIHCVNGLLVYVLALQLFRSMRDRLQETNIGLYGAGVALLWMVHPIQLSSVLYVVQRMTSLSALFLLIALILHVRARQDGVSSQRVAILMFFGWAVFWPLSVLSKESGILFPGFVAAYELIIRRSAKGRLDVLGRSALYLSIGFLSVLSVYLVSPWAEWLFQGYGIRSFSLGERLLTEARVFWEYLRLILLPGMESFALYHDDIPLSKDLLTPWTTLPAIVASVFLAAGGFMARQRFPLIAFGIAWFFIGHSLESTFIPLELVHEHRNYLPLLGVGVAIIGAMDFLIARHAKNRELIVIMATLFAVYCIFLTALRSDMFQNDLIRTQVEAQHHPASARANYEAGRAMASVVDRDRSNLMAYALARKHYELATEADRNFKLGLLGVLVLDCVMSGSIDPSVVDNFSVRLERTPYSAEDKEAMRAISEMSSEGTLCLERHDLERLFASALSNPGIPPDAKARLHVWLADYLWLHLRDLAGARKSIQAALELMPADASNRLKWAQLTFLSGQEQEAHRLLLELRGESFSPEEKKTLDELLFGLENQK
ncbi:MAG: hypothetical protein JNK92_01140 [Dechloromonas sp.]|nr:hypothetical protein [Dechloromonas sp.]